MFRIKALLFLESISIIVTMYIGVYTRLLYKWESLGCMLDDMFGSLATAREPSLLTNRLQRPSRRKLMFKPRPGRRSSDQPLEMPLLTSQIQLQSLLRHCPPPIMISVMHGIHVSVTGLSAYYLGHCGRGWAFEENKEGCWMSNPFLARA